ncbi:unnamed protein product, partial [Discosporangium mesarthrocarpum]
IAEEDNVLVLTADNFQEAIDEHSTLLVEFYAPWCGHCKKLAPEYAKAAGELKEEGLRIAKVDADAEKSLARDYGVSGFPTLKLFKEGKPLDYNSGRNAKDIVAYVKKKSGPSAKAVTSVEEVKEFVGDQEVVVLGVFSDADSAAAKAFMKVADGLDRLPFAVSSDAAVISDNGGGDKVIIMKTFDDLRSELAVAADTSAEAMEEFVSTYSMRLVTKFSPESSAAVFGGPIKVHLLLMANEGDESAPLLETVTKVCPSLPSTMRGKLLHVHVPASEERVLAYFDVSAEDLPRAVLVDMGAEGGMKKYL